MKDNEKFIKIIATNGDSDWHKPELFGLTDLGRVYEWRGSYWSELKNPNLPNKDKE